MDSSPEQAFLEQPVKNLADRPEISAHQAEIQPPRLAPGSPAANREGSLKKEAAAPANGSPAEQVPAWREELSARVESFRRRRARMRQNFSPNLNLDFDFDLAGDEEARKPTLADVLDLSKGRPELDDIPSAPEGTETPILDGLPLDNPADGPEAAAPLESRAAELFWGGRGHEGAPVDIVIESPAPVTAAPAQPNFAYPLAPLGRRFLAGLADAVVLLSAAGLFALVFWRAGGRITPQPLNFLILGSIAGFFVLAYVAVFTALTASTPGLLWMGLEVRSFSGERPSVGQSFWRGFGFLVSVSGLMLGFLWALLDSDSLTWHDRISGTFLTPALHIAAAAP